MLIGIYDGCGFNVKVDENTPFLGGSETWLIEMATALSNMGHRVFLFCNTEFHENNRIAFIPKSKLAEVSSRVKYNVFVWSRGIEHYDCVRADRKGVFLHDTTLTDYGDNGHLRDLSSIFVLSDWSKRYFQEIYGHECDDKIRITFNGVHQELYNMSVPKTKSMVWSSCFERGLTFFTKYVLPLVKDAVPEFELKVCSYNKYGNKYDGVKFLGQLNKPQLAKEQCQAKIWCYPNLGYTDYESTFKETFCITAVENALAGNCILTTNLGGLGTTAMGIDFLSNEFYHDEKITALEDYGKYLADKCISALNGEIYTSFDASRYSWTNAAQDILAC